MIDEEEFRPSSKMIKNSNSMSLSHVTPQKGNGFVPIAARKMKEKQ